MVLRAFPDINASRPLLLGARPNTEMDEKTPEVETDPISARGAGRIIASQGLGQADFVVPKLDLSVARSADLF